MPIAQGELVRPGESGGCKPARLYEYEFCPPITPYIVGVVGIGPGLTGSGTGLYLRTVCESMSHMSPSLLWSCVDTAPSPKPKKSEEEPGAV